MKRYVEKALVDPACRMWRVSLPYATYGILVRHGVIVYGGVSSWAVGKTLGYFMHWVESKGGTIERSAELQN